MKKSGPLQKMHSKMLGKSENFKGQRQTDTGKHKPHEAEDHKMQHEPTGNLSKHHALHEHDPRNFVQVRDQMPHGAGALHEAETGELATEQVFHSSDARIHTDASAHGGVQVRGVSAAIDPWPGPHPRGV